MRLDRKRKPAHLRKPGLRKLSRNCLGGIDLEFDVLIRFDRSSLRSIVKYLYGRLSNFTRQNIYVISLDDLQNSHLAFGKHLCRISSSSTSISRGRRGSSELLYYINISHHFFSSPDARGPIMCITSQHLTSALHYK